MTGRMVAERYELLERLGRGAMGEVWRARDVRLQRDVAIKLVDLASQDPTVAQRFEREAITTARLASPHIVSIYDAGSDEHTAWLVMELLEGRSLADLLREQGRLEPAVALGYGAQVAAGLAAAHEVGVTHRDIKPANVMLHRGSARIVDFGIARLTETLGQTLTAPASVIGTAAYMAPEQALGNPAGPASDVYALGCLLFALVTGEPPFRGESAIAVARAQVTDPAPRLSSRLVGCPPALERLLDAMLAKDPAARPTAADVTDALRRIAADPTLSPADLPPTVVQPAVASTTVLPADAAAATVALSPTQGVPGNLAPATATAVLPAAATARIPSPAHAVAPTPPAARAASRQPRRRGGWWALLVLLLLTAALALVGLFVWPGWAKPAPAPVVTITPPPVTVTAVTSAPAAKPAAPATATTAPTTTAASVASNTATRPASTAPATTAGQRKADVTKEVADVADAIGKVKDDRARAQLQKAWDPVAAKLDSAGPASQLAPVQQVAASLLAAGVISQGESNQVQKALTALAGKLG